MAAWRRTKLIPFAWLRAEERQLVLARYHGSPLTQREFSSREGIAVWTLFKWLQREGAAVRSAVKLQEVILPGVASGCSIEVVSSRAGKCAAAQSVGWRQLS